MPTAFPDVFARISADHADALRRLYPSGLPTHQQIRAFERHLDDCLPRADPARSAALYRGIDVWDHSRQIIREAAERCPTSMNEGSPTLSQVYLELVATFLLPHDELYHSARRLVEPLCPADPDVRAVYELTRLTDQGLDHPKPVVSSLRNALAHQSLVIDPQSGTVAYPAGKGNHTVTRALEDVTLFGEIIFRFTISALRAHLSPPRTADSGA